MGGTHQSGGIPGRKEALLAREHQLSQLGITRRGVPPPPAVPAVMYCIGFPFPAGP